MHKQALTIREVTETYPVSRSKLYAEIRAGKLKTCKFGRRTIITAAKLFAGGLRSPGRHTNEPRPDVGPGGAPTPPDGPEAAGKADIAGIPSTKAAKPKSPISP